MSHMSVYIITLSEDVEDAKSEVSSWLDEYANREFFSGGKLEEPENVRLVRDIVDELKKLKTASFRLIPWIYEQIQKCKAEKKRISEGTHYIRYGRILSEEPCTDMPFFNISEWDWTIPMEVPEDANGCQWYAVMVDLHY